LWIAQHGFHASYNAIGYIGLAFAVAGAGVLVFYAPFPRIVKWPLLFTYVMVYQYAVIARSYTLLPLLCFCAAIFFKDLKHPERITIVLFLLANLCLHGIVLAGCIGLAYLVDAYKAWPSLTKPIRYRYVVCAAFLLTTFGALAAMLKPTADVEEVALRRGMVDLPQSVRNQIFVPVSRKLMAVVTGAFLDYPLPTFLFLAISTAWCIWRRRWLIFVLPVGLLIALYGKIHGAAHHHGTVFIAAITAFWIAWPTKSEAQAFGKRARYALNGMVVALICLCAVNIWDSVVVIQHEYRYPYSGAEDAANYVKKVGADQGPMFGMLFGVVGVQAYFDHNLFANMPTSYFHHGVPLYGTTLDLAELNRIRPPYIVCYSMEPELMVKTGFPVLNEQGYELEHFSDGYYLYKRGVYEREVYFVFRRVRP
jgi:hypothetical protein